MQKKEKNTPRTRHLHIYDFVTLTRSTADRISSMVVYTYTRTLIIVAFSKLPPKHHVASRRPSYYTVNYNAVNLNAG